MPKVRFETGQVVNFDSMPSQRDIEEVAAKLNLKSEEPSLNSELAAPFRHAASFALGDIPKEIQRRGDKETFKELYPEQKTPLGKALRGGLTIPVLVSGVPAKIAGYTFAKAAPLAKFGMFGKMGRAGSAGLAFEATTAKPTTEEYGKSLVGGFVGGASIPVAGELISKSGKGLSKFGEFIAENVGGVTKATRETINKLGAQRVFDPMKAQADYVGKQLVPQVIRKINSFDAEVQSSLKKYFKVPEDIINILKETDTKNSEELRQKADDVYKLAVENTPKDFGGTIDVRDTLKSMKGVFKGSLGEATRGPQGQRLFTIMKELESRRPAPGGFYKNKVPTPSQLSRQIKGGENLIDIADEVRLNKKQFMEVRDALNGLYRENPYDRNVAKVMNQLYSDGEKSGLTGLMKARELQRKAFEVEGSNFERIMSKLNDPKVLESTLISLKNSNKYNSREAFKELIGVDNYDNLIAHFANQDFGLVSKIPGPGGGIYTGRSGLIRAGVSDATKRYYRDFNPLKNKVIQKIDPIKKAAEKAIKKHYGIK